MAREGSLSATRHLLVISHFFPPMGGGGVQRISKFVKYLDRHGWRATVICGQPEDYWMRDDSLLHDLPASLCRRPVSGASGLGILRRLRPRSTQQSVRSASGFSILRRLSSWMLIPDSYIGWRRFALRQARAVLRDDPPQAILSTGPPETNHLVARAVQHASGLPWVADFRDPWFALHLHPAPSRWHRWRHSVLERQVLTQASAVLATTRWLGELLQQHGAPAARVHVIRNGFDPEDFSRPSEESFFYQSFHCFAFFTLSFTPYQFKNIFKPRYLSLCNFHVFGK
jgi:glycosyltransferase involved in cell wall biosynthesis